MNRTDIRFSTRAAIDGFHIVIQSHTLCLTVSVQRSLPVRFGGCGQTRRLLSGSFVKHILSDPSKPASDPGSCC